jgi:response regulator RpfG family c-di-GMP phosphodiesterase
MFERWDGKGSPGLLAGSAISRPVRLVQLADVVEVIYGGPVSMGRWRWRGSEAARSLIRRSLSVPR